MPYANLLSVDAWFQWDKIVISQVNTAPWTDVRGKEQPGVCTRSFMSFMDCVMLHLQKVFANGAAEQEHYYISNALKKPQHVPVRYFFQQLEQLNSYLL